MNIFFPLFYIGIILVFLMALLRLILKQIFFTKKIQKQINRVKIAIDLYQASLTTYLNLGQIYLKKQIYSDAIEIFRKCLLKWDKNDKIGLCYLYTGISFAYSKLNFFDIAQCYLEQAIFNLPTCRITLNNLLYIYKQRNLVKKCVEISLHTSRTESKNQ